MAPAVSVAPAVSDSSVALEVQVVLLQEYLAEVVTSFTASVCCMLAPYILEKLTPSSKLGDSQLQEAVDTYCCDSTRTVGNGQHCRPSSGVTLVINGDHGRFRAPSRVPVDFHDSHNTGVGWNR